MSGHLEELFRLVLEASWQGSLVIVLILCLRPFMGALIPARWRFFLWMLVLVRLLVPISVFPPSPVSMQNVPLVDHPLEQAGFSAASEPGSPFILRQGPMATEEFPPVTGSGRVSHPVSISWWIVLSTMWLTGVAVALAAMIVAQIMLHRRIAKMREPDDSTILAAWKTCLERLRIRRAPQLRVSTDISSPALVGLFRPTLLLPACGTGKFLGEDWENVFVHELAHYCRGDHATHLLQLVALALHWFNPVVWIGFRQLRADRELAADEWALQRLGGESRTAAYGDTLLKVLDQSGNSPLSTASVGILEDRIELKQRLQRIVAFGPRTVIGSILGFVIVIVVAFLVLGRPTEKPDMANYPDMTPNEIIIKAAWTGDLPMIKQALRDGADMNTIGGYYHQTPMSAAASCGKLEVIKYLVGKGADIQLKSDKGLDAIEDAMAQGEPDCADYLLAKGAKVDPGYLAAYKGDMTGISSALAQTPFPLDKAKVMGRIAANNGKAEAYMAIKNKIRTQPGESYWRQEDGQVLVTIARGHREVIKAMIDSGDIDPKNGGSVMRMGKVALETPGMREWMLAQGFNLPEYTDGERLIDAAEIEDIPEMERLLKKGVDINYSGESSWTPITKAATWRRPHSVKFLLAHGADPNSVHIPQAGYTGICLTGDPKIAQMLFDAGGKVDAPLFGIPHNLMSYAVSVGHTETVKWFLDHGVDPTKAGPSRDGGTYLFHAGSPEIAEMLIAHGLDVNAKDKDGTTALYWVCMLGGDKAADTARVLLKHGADPNARDNRGTTPIMVARNGAIVDVLCDYGADLTVKPVSGGSLITSIGMRDSTCLDALIRHGAPFDPKTDGPTLMMMAAWRNGCDLISALLKRGVDPNAKGLWNAQANDWMTPLVAAVVDGRGQLDAAKVLIQGGATITDEVMRAALGNHRTKMIRYFWEQGNRSIPELTYQISQKAPVDEIRKLLDAGAPADMPKTTVSMSPLALAAGMGQLDVVQLLVERGAKPGKDTDALADAAEEGQDEVVAFLLQKGAKPDYQSLWNVAWNCRPYPDQRSKDHFQKTMKLLLDAGAAKGLSEEQSAEILTAAIFSRYPGSNITMLKMLLDAGLPLNSRMKDGKTVLDLVHFACKQESCQTPSKELLAFLAPYETGKAVK